MSAAITMPPWTGEGEDLRGATFGHLTVEAPATRGDLGVRVTVRCSCGRVGVRYVAYLASGRARACARCRPAEHALGDSRSKRRAPPPPELGPFFADAEVVERFFSKVAHEPNTGCMFWLGALDKDGYGKFQIHDYERSAAAGRQRQWHVRAHRFALATKIRRWPRTDLLVCHSCDIPCCVAPDHLSEGTQKQNLRGMIERGRLGRRSRVGRGAAGETHPGGARGALHGGAKLDHAQVREIRERRRGGERPGDLAREYGVQPATIWAIATGRTWRTE